jgi:hypothetical protein
MWFVQRSTGADLKWRVVLHVPPKNIPVCIADHKYDLESRDGGGGARRAGQAVSVEGHW